MTCLDVPPALRNDPKHHCKHSRDQASSALPAEHKRRHLARGPVQLRRISIVATCRRGCCSATKEQCASRQLEPSIGGREVYVAASHERQVSDPPPRHFGPRADVRLWRRGRLSWGTFTETATEGHFCRSLSLNLALASSRGSGRCCQTKSSQTGGSSIGSDASFDKCSDLIEDVRAAVAASSAIKLVGATRATMPSRSGSWTCGSSTSSTAVQRRERANASRQRPLRWAGV